MGPDSQDGHEGYPRPPATPAPYRRDLGCGRLLAGAGVVGLVVAVLGIVLGGYLLIPRDHPGDEFEHGLTANDVGSAAGMVVIAFSVFLGIAAAFALVGGVGVTRGRETGFWVTGAFFGLVIVAGLTRLPAGLIAVFPSSLALVYCYRRLAGKEGPEPR